MKFTLEDLKTNGEAPHWLDSPAYKTLCEGYLLDGETPKGMYWRVANSSAKYLKKPELAKKFFDYMWSNWLCLATPVATNLGTDRGLPISCFGVHLGDSVLSIMDKLKEVGLLIKNGGGVGIYVGNLRDRGLPISKGNGTTDGIVPFLKMYESVLSGISQGGVRRGSGAIYDHIKRSETQELIKIRTNTGGDIASKCISPAFNHAFCIDDEDWDDFKFNRNDKRQVYHDLLQVRHQYGQPYLSYIDNINRQIPEAYKKNNLKVTHSQLCNEITLFSDPEHTYVCCLSSVNLARYDEWKDTDLIETCMWFLDGVLEEFIQKAKFIPGLECAVRSAIKERAVGLGVLGYHDLLQSRMVPFESFEATLINGEVFKMMNERSLKASQDLAKEYGEPEWCKGTGVRNSHRLAIAPTRTNSTISGGVSQGIQPYAGNCFVDKGAKGWSVKKNPYLQKLLASIGKDTPEVWQNIADREGSVAGLKFLTSDQKAVFATFREINQFTIIQQAAQRQKNICQGQSLNLAFAKPKDVTNEDDRIKLGKYIIDVHRMAYEMGLKGAYYLKSTAVLSGDKVFREEGECLSCEG